MRVIKAFPPNYTAIRRAFPHIAGRELIFAYGDRIYYPAGKYMSPALLAHEGVHGKRQGVDPGGWWERYLADGAFRLDEEVLAHRAEYQTLEAAGARGSDLDFVVKRLCSPLYGADLTVARARELIAG